MIVSKLYDLLQSRGLKQRQLHQETRIREATISHLCNNVIKGISLDHINKICNVLNCKIEDVVEHTSD